MTWEELYSVALVELIRKSGVREWQDTETRLAIIAAAVDFANIEGVSMALPDYFKLRAGTPIVLAATGGNYAISLASVASVVWGSATTTGARQGVTVDFGDSQGNVPLWVHVRTDFILAATPTLGNMIQIFGPFGSTDPTGVCGTLGTDSAFTGLNNNGDASILGLPVLATHVCTTNATPTIQKLISGRFQPGGRYWNPIVRNMSGAAFHSSNTDQQIVLTPYYQVIQDTESGA